MRGERERGEREGEREGKREREREREERGREREERENSAAAIEVFSLRHTVASSGFNEVGWICEIVTLLPDLRRNLHYGAREGESFVCGKKR